MSPKPTPSANAPQEAEERLALAAGADEPSKADRARIHAAFSRRLLGLGVAIPPSPKVAPGPPVLGPTSPPAPGTAASASAGKAASVAGTAGKLGTLAKVGAGVGIGMALTFAVIGPARHDAHGPAAGSPASAPSKQPAVHANPARQLNAPAVPQAPEVAQTAVPVPAPRVARAPLAARRAERAQQASVEPPASAETAVPPAPIDRLQAEVALIEDVRAALRADEPVRALGMLRLHEREFAGGALAEERAGLRVLALCAAGDRVRGLAERARFLEQAPRSVLARSVQAACGERAAAQGDGEGDAPPATR